MGFGWHPIYEMENKSHVPNHQAAVVWPYLNHFWGEPPTRSIASSRLRIHQSNILLEQVLSVENGSPSSKLDYQRELANKRISAKASVVTPFVGQVQVEFVQRLTLQQEKKCIKLLSNQPQYRYSPNSTWKHNKNPKIRIEMMWCFVDLGLEDRGKLLPYLWPPMTIHWDDDSPVDSRKGVAHFHLVVLSKTPLKNDGVKVSWGPMTFPPFFGK